MKAGWKTVKLGDIALVGAGNSAPQDDADFSTDGPYFVRTSDVGEVKFGTVNSSNDRLSSKGAKGMRLWKEGTILIPKSGASTFVNHRVILGLDAHVSSHLATIQAEPTRCDARYLLYYLSTVKAQDLIQDQSYPSLKLPEIAGIEIPLPPLAEQKRIVALLDEAFAGLDEAKAKVEANHRDSEGLYKSYLQSVFKEGGRKWLEVKLDEVCEFQNGFAFKSNTFRPSGTPVIRISNIQDGIIDTENRLVFVDPKDYRENLDRYRVAKGDLLIAMSGATTGKIGFNTTAAEFYLNQRVGKFQPGKSLNKQFLYHFLSTKVEENLSISAGAAQPNLSTEQIKGFVLPLPPIEEQASVVVLMETLLAETRQLASLCQGKQVALAALKNSFLAQAFAGELTA